MYIDTKVSIIIENILKKNEVFNYSRTKLEMLSKIMNTRIILD